MNSALFCIWLFESSVDRRFASEFIIGIPVLMCCNQELTLFLSLLFFFFKFCISEYSEDLLDLETKYKGKGNFRICFILVGWNRGY